MPIGKQLKDFNRAVTTMNCSNTAVMHAQKLQIHQKNYL